MKKRESVAKPIAAGYVNRTGGAIRRPQISLERQGGFDETMRRIRKRLRASEAFQSPKKVQLD